MNDTARIELLRPIRMAGEIIPPCPEMTLPLSMAAALVHGHKARFLADHEHPGLAAQEHPASVVEVEAVAEGDDLSGATEVPDGGNPQ